MTNNQVWQTKLHARLHDPAEKALVLLRDPAGHENGTSRAVHRLLGFHELPAEHIDPDNAEVLHKVLFQNGIPRALYDIVKRADWWAAAADRPQWPMQEIDVETKLGERTFKVADFAQVRWTKKPILTHPLSGCEADLVSLNDTDFHDIKRSAFDHLSALMVALGAQSEGEHNWKKLLLTFWRFGPEMSSEHDHCKLGELWKLLPADTRVPDHSIWDHLDLTSAFAGAFAADDKHEATLLSLSIGPVQGFIAAARSTSDLWAGSHLLSRLAWEAIKPICEAIGPDAVLFPRLRGIPQVDLWLKEECQLPAQLFEQCEWNKTGDTDSNPLFSAALPNRFVAIVPSGQAKALAERCEKAVRDWLLTLGFETVDQLLRESGLMSQEGTRDESVYAYQQVKTQLQGFPEVHWAAVPFSLIKPRNIEKQNDLDISALQDALAPFSGSAAGQSAGFLDSEAWKVLGTDQSWQDRTTFFSPNPGVLYPAIYDLAERLLASAKSVRSFDALSQQGWRDSLTGEFEWLTEDASQLKLPPGQRTETLWAKISKSKPSWAKTGEHLGALSAIKRLWPTIFAEEASSLTGKSFERFVVSTHTMSLSQTLSVWLKADAPNKLELKAILDKHGIESVALPAKLVRAKFAGDRLKTLAIMKKVPALFDLLKENDPEDECTRKSVLKLLTQTTHRPETYYALVLLDGDRLGEILSGSTKHAISYAESFHPQVRVGFERHAQTNPQLQKYGQSKRALSPNRHLAISAALNDFSQTVVRHIVEVEFMGKLIYSGGDDVLAMMSVADLLPCMDRLRLAYSGQHSMRQSVQSQDTGDSLKLKNGFAYLDGRVMRMMGENATASAGAVIVHHQTPLSVALRELRSAEQRAKNEGGRNAFSVSLMKRGGGTTHFTAKWDDAIDLLIRTRDFLALDSVSRRAVYHCLAWMTDLPDDIPESMLSQMLRYQFERQTSDSDKTARDQLPSLCQAMASSALRDDSSNNIGGQASRHWRKKLSSFLICAEFLVREVRKIEGATVEESEAGVLA